MAENASHFIVLQPNAPVTVVALGALPAELGSAAEADIQILDPEVASQHASIFEEDGQLIVEAHAMPFLVNGQKLERHALRHLDLITIGRTALSFRTGPVVTPEQGVLPSGLALCRRLNRFSERIDIGGPASELTRHFLSDLLALTGAERGVLLRFSHGRAETLGLADASSGDFSQAEASFSNTVLARLRENGRAVLVTDATSDLDLASAPSIVAAGTRSVICAPLHDAGALVGAVYLSSTSAQGLLTSCLELVTTYATHAVRLLGVAQRGRAISEELARSEQTGMPSSRRPAQMLVGSSTAMSKARQQLTQMAPHDIAVLLIGETGTGKEVAARQLHRLSARADGPFVAVNCGAIPDALLQSELFGHAKGAFTHAQRDRKGWIRTADEGTLFLDEIGEMAPAQQAMLLRVLQDHEVTPLGAERSYPVDFRLVCATNRDLAALIQEGRFREDLYYRIADVTISLPPLRARGDDAVELAEHFLRLHRVALKRPGLRLGASALTVVRKERWPGNVRELEAKVRRAALLCGSDVLRAADFGLDDGAPCADEDEDNEVRALAQVRDEFLKEYVQSAVAHFDGNRSAAARALGVSVRTVFKYLEER